jgi:GntR family transcriptional regulator
MALKSTVIERNSPLPLYHQLKQVLLQRIEEGVWKPGELIPGEQELQDTFNLSRTTVRQALRELELDGKVIRYRGRGTFVNTPKLAHSPEPSEGFGASLVARGMTPGWQLLAKQLVPVPAAVAASLGVKPDQQVCRLVRLRLANQEPLGRHVAHIAPDFISIIDDRMLTEGGSLDYLNAPQLLEGSRAERVLEAVPADEKTAEQLGVEVGAAMQRIRRRLVTADGQPVEDLEAIYRGDRFEYRVSSVGVLAR